MTAATATQGDSGVSVSNVLVGATAGTAFSSKPASGTPTERTLVNYSYANLQDVTFQHLHWTLEIDFATQQLRGSAEYTFSFTASDRNAPPVVVLDTNQLVIESVAVDGKPVAFMLQPAAHGAAAAFGRALVIPIAAHTTKVKVTYATTANSSDLGLMWLPKELTVGKTHPFVFTQSRATLARSFVPSPDMSAATFTHTALVTVPAWTTVLLSALADESTRHHRPRNAPPGKRVVAFHQDVPVSPHLLALAAGRMESAELGPRSRVWAEPSVVAFAAYEFAKTEMYMRHIEAILDVSCVYGRCDLACLPPSVPHGEMVAMPCVAFVSSTLLAGDRSLADVVVQSLAYAWTGHVVTYRTWRDRWLADAWATWLARKVLARIANDVRVFDLYAAVGQCTLVASVERLGATNPATRLVPAVDDTDDPNAVDAVVPAEKGFCLLHYLLTVAGGHDVFDAFVRAYIARFRFQTVTTETFRAFVTTYFTDVVDLHAEITQIDWSAWLDAPGLPPVLTPLDTTLATQATALADRMLASADAATYGRNDTLATWSTTLWILLLDSLLQQQQTLSQRLTPAHLDAIDTFTGHRLTTTHNAELCVRWFALALRSRDLRQLDAIVQFLCKYGCMTYVQPLYRDLCAAVGPVRAAAIFAQSKRMYHPSVLETIARDIDAAASRLTARASRSDATNAISATLARWLAIPDTYASYSPLVALTLATAVAGTVAVVASRRHR